MSSIRVLVGAKVRLHPNVRCWKLSGPHFVGWEIFHLTGSIADPNRLYASQHNSWFGQLIQRSNDGGETWEPTGNKFLLDGDIANYEGHDGTPQPWEFKRVWHLKPSLSDPQKTA